MFCGWRRVTINYNKSNCSISSYGIVFRKESRHKSTVLPVIKKVMEKFVGVSCSLTLFRKHDLIDQKTLRGKLLLLQTCGCDVVLWPTALDTSDCLVKCWIFQTWNALCSHHTNLPPPLSPKPSEQRILMSVPVYSCSLFSHVPIFLYLSNDTNLSLSFCTLKSTMSFQ